MNFSNRTSWNVEESELAQTHRECLESGSLLSDLTIANPTRCGFEYPPDLLSPLCDAQALDYDPNPRGSLRARQAIANYYAQLGAEINPENLILTTSTSEAYSFLFKLLCNPGDEILVPQPSYPLFDYLADLEDVKIVGTPLIYDYSWQLDFESLRRSVTPRTRAIIIVHPNNPTGHFTKNTESLGLAEICREHNLALIVDEVFLDYGFKNKIDPDPKQLFEAPEWSAASEDLEVPDDSGFATRALGVLTFVVSGLSKIAGLPQMKAAWLLAAGTGSEEALSRLEVLADTFLSMNAPVQRAIPAWLAGRAEIQTQIRDRTRKNLAELDRVLAHQPLSQSYVNRLKVEGGWYAVLRVPALEQDEQTVLHLLKLGVWVHPGHFFGFPSSGWLVVSLLAREEEFSTGTTILVENFARKDYEP